MSGRFAMIIMPLICCDCNHSVASLNWTPLGPKKRFSLERFPDKRGSICTASIESRT